MATAEINTNPTATNPLDVEHCNAILQRFHAFFDRFANGVRESHFDQLKADVSTEATTFNMAKMATEYRDNLRSCITADFDEMWENLEVAESLTMLRKIGNRPRADPTKTYRPYDKSVIEQTRTFRVRALRYKIKFIAKQLAAQVDAMRELFLDVEQRRMLVQKTEERRAQLTYAMKLHMQAISDANKVLADLRVAESNIGPVMKS